MGVFLPAVGEGWALATLGGELGPESGLLFEVSTGKQMKYRSNKKYNLQWQAKKETYTPSESCCITEMPLEIKLNSYFKHAVIS
jgi:hypothetical protein